MSPPRPVAKVRPRSNGFVWHVNWIATLPPSQPPRQFFNSMVRPTPRNLVRIHAILRFILSCFSQTKVTRSLRIQAAYAYCPF